MFAIEISLHFNIIRRPYVAVLILVIAKAKCYLNCSDHLYFIILRLGCTRKVDIK